MHFDQRSEGDYRIYAGALESPMGDGYVAAVVVNRMRPDDMEREAFREIGMSDGHRWQTPLDALRYAVAKAREVIRTEPARLSC